MSNQDQLLQEIFDRVQAQPNADDIVLRPQFRQMVLEVVNDLKEDDEFIRKMRFGASGADSRLAGSKFARWNLSVADIEFLFDMQSALQMANPQKYQGPSESLRGAFDHISEALYMPDELVRQIDQRAIDNLFPRLPKSLFSGSDLALFERGAYDKMGAYKDAVRAMDTAESGYGSQLIGAQYVGSLWEAARRESRVFNLLEAFEMTDPTAYLPVEADIPEMLFVAENTSATASDYATSKTGSNRVTVAAKKLLIHQIWSGEMEEDSILPYVPFLRRQVQLSLAHYSDSLVLNGDTTNAATGNINLDDADPADTKHYLAFDGVRHVGLVDNTGNQDNVAAAIDFASLLRAKNLLLDDTYLMDWGEPTNPMDLVYVADPRTGRELQNISEVVNSRIERQRPLLTGELGDIYGHPIISSMAMSRTEADGKVSTTGSNNTKGQIAVFNRRAFAVGWRRRVRTAVEYLPGRDQMRMVHSLRMGLGRYSPTGAASGIEAAAVLFNITLP